MINKQKLIRAARLILALALGILAGSLLQIPMSGWITVTTIVVLFDQSTVGGTISRSSLRFMATFLGAFVSLFCILFIGDNWPLIWIFLAVTTFGYAYYYMDTKKSYIGILGIATMAILLLGAEQPNLHVALYRLLDIIIGITIALLSMLVFYPEYAIDKAKNLIFIAIKDIDNLINSIKSEADPEVIRKKILTVENKFLGDVVNFNKTIDEAKFEWKVKRNPHILDKYNKAFLQIRRLYRLIIVIFYYEFDHDKIDLPYVNEIFFHISKILNQLITNEVIFFDNETHIKLDELINQLTDPTIRKMANNFIRELAKLNELLAV